MEKNHGFYPGHYSAVTYNLVFVNYVFDTFINVKKVDVIYIDFNKAVIQG